MPKNVQQEIDLGVLEKHIGTLRMMKNEWEAKHYTAPIDEMGCGGSTILMLEATDKLFQEMQDAFVLLLKNTHSYMLERKSSVEEKEQMSSQVIAAAQTKPLIMTNPDPVGRKPVASVITPTTK